MNAKKQAILDKMLKKRQNRIKKKGWWFEEKIGAKGKKRIWQTLTLGK